MKWEYLWTHKFIAPWNFNIHLVEEYTFSGEKNKPGGFKIGFM